MALITGWDRGTWGQGTWNSPLPVEVTGVSAAAAIGSVGVVRAVAITLTGVSAAAAIGTAGVGKGVSPTGVQAVAGIGQVLFWNQIIPEQDANWIKIAA